VKGEKETTPNIGGGKGKEPSLPLFSHSGKSTSRKKKTSGIRLIGKKGEGKRGLFARHQTKRKEGVPREKEEAGSSWTAWTKRSKRGGKRGEKKRARFVLTGG